MSAPNVQLVLTDAQAWYVLVALQERVKALDGEIAKSGGLPRVVEDGLKGVLEERGVLDQVLAQLDAQPSDLDDEDGAE